MKALEIALFWIMTLAAGGFFAWTIRQRIATLKAGLPDNRFDQPWVRLKGVFTLAILQKRMVRDKDQVSITSSSSGASARWRCAPRDWCWRACSRPST